jgi:hypothetical protein
MASRKAGSASDSRGGPNTRSHATQVEITEEHTVVTPTDNSQRNAEVKMFWQVERISNPEIRNILLDWMDTEIDIDRAEFISRLADQLPALKPFSRGIVSTSTAYFLIRDIRMARGHNVSEMSTSVSQCSIFPRVGDAIIIPTGFPV